MRHSQDRRPPSQEISRWSKTTTESEASEALQEPPTKKMSILKKKIKERRQSKDTTKSSPVDPFYDPVTRKLQPIPHAGTPPMAMTAPDELPTFYDSGSDDSSDAEASIHRASSVRVSKPHIVQHSNGSGGSVPKLYAAQSTPTDALTSVPGIAPSYIALAQDINELYDSTASAGRADGPRDALKALEGHDSHGDAVTARHQVSAAADKEPNDGLKETVLELPDTLEATDGLGTLPTPLGGFGSIRIPSAASETVDSSSTFASAPSVDGLRSNPVTETDKKLSRAISAPVRNSTRRVTIRPADLVIDRASNQHKLFREDIVSTPYPARHSSIGEVDEGDFREKRLPRSFRRTRVLSYHEENEAEDEKASGAQELELELSPKPEQVPEVPLSTKPLPSAPLTSKSDRFPSPVAPEVLILDLRLARHPSARLSVEIEISDKTTFDDKQLFTIIAESYNHKLLGLARRFCSARTLSHASLWNNGTRPAPLGSTEIDDADFIKHLLRPAHGRRRKTWLLWLRNNQYQESPATLARWSRISHSPQAAESSPVFSFTHSRNNSNSNSNASPISPAPGSLSAHPSITIPRMPFQPAPSRSKSHLSAARSSRSSRLYTTTTRLPTANSIPLSASHTGPPTIYLQHRFSLPKILAVLFLIFFLAVFTATMWILFGLPGRGADQGNGSTLVEGKAYTLSWKRDAQARVGVGLVMGIVVLALGIVSEAVWVWASWVLV